MDKKVIIRNIGLMVVFGSAGVTLFTENVKTVQFRFGSSSPGGRTR